MMQEPAQGPDDQEFQAMIDQALSELPGEHVKRISNIALLWEDEPTPEQRHELMLRHDQTLLGLYQGVPLPQRQGHVTTYPDRITLFRGPLIRKSTGPEDLKENIKHTLWHEIAHYYGLDHDKIRELEQ